MKSWENYQGRTTCVTSRLCRSTNPRHSVDGAVRRRIEALRRGHYCQRCWMDRPVKALEDGWPPSLVVAGTEAGVPERRHQGHGMAWAKLAPCLAMDCSPRPKARTSCWRSARTRHHCRGRVADQSGCWIGCRHRYWSSCWSAARSTLENRRWCRLRQN